MYNYLNTYTEWNIHNHVHWLFVFPNYINLTTIKSLPILTTIKQYSKSQAETTYILHFIRSKATNLSGSCLWTSNARLNQFQGPQMLGPRSTQEYSHRLETTIRRKEKENESNRV